MADIINITDKATEVVAALNEATSGDFSVDMTATRFVGEVNTAFPDASADVSDTATKLVGKINEAADAEPVTAPEPIKFLHYSDQHGTAMAYPADPSYARTTAKAVKVMTDTTDSNYDADVDFIIDTGDNNDHGFYTGVPTAFINADTDTNGKHFVMMGNHDINDANTGYNRDHAAMAAALRTYMTNAAPTFGGEGKAYWYKDFPLTNGGKLRLIATDEYDIGTGYSGFGNTTIYQPSQIEWLVGLLNGLTSKDYFIIGTHNYPMGSQHNVLADGERLPNIKSFRAANKFCSNYLWDWGVESNGNMAIFADIVNAYLKGTSISKTYTPYSGTSVKVGKGVNDDLDVDFSGVTSKAAFVCFLCGHLHGEVCHRHPVYNGQNGLSALLVLDIDCAKNAATIGDKAGDESDIPTASRTGVLMNKVTIDFAKHQVKVDRIGAKNVPARTIDKVNDQHDVGDSHVDGYTYPAITRDTITFDFTTAQVVEDQ